MKVCVFPGDLRQNYISEYLTINGIENKKIYSFEKSDVYIIPTPFSKDGININTHFKKPLLIKEFIENLDNNSILISGGIKPDTLALLNEKSVKVFDYLKDSDMTKYNAQLTANGLLHDIIEHTPFSLLSSNVFIIGYGNCGKSIAQILDKLVKCIYIYDHTEKNIERAIHDGYNEVYYDEILSQLSTFNVIINTVPTIVLTEEHLSIADKNAYFFEIASSPFGFQKETFDSYNLNLVYCPGLPGKYTPMSAGYKIGQYIYNNLKGC